MREDLHTPTPEAASAHARHHAVEPLPASYGIQRDDVDFTMGLNGCGGCVRRGCLECALARVFGGGRL